MSDKLVCKNCNNLMTANLMGFSNNAGRYNDMECHRCGTRLHIFLSSWDNKKSYTWLIPIFYAYTEANRGNGTFEIYNRASYKTLGEAKQAAYSDISNAQNELNWTTEMSRGSLIYTAIRDKSATYKIIEMNLVEKLDEFPNNYIEAPFENLPSYWVEIESSAIAKIQSINPDLETITKKILDLNRYYNRFILAREDVSMHKDVIETCSRALATRILMNDKMPFIELQIAGNEAILNN